MLLIGAAMVYWMLFGDSDSERTRYVTEPALVGTLVVTVSATGNLQPTNQVDVGSELSGTVKAVYVEENDQVSRNQVLARLDRSKLQDAVARSEANLAAAETQVLQARATVAEARARLARLRRMAVMSGGKVPSPSELDTAEANLKRAEANEASARAAVAVAPVSVKHATAVYQARNWSTNITGTTNDYFKAGDWVLAAGRAFSEPEERAGKTVCVIGETIRDKLFGGGNPVGGEIRIKQFACEVIGLLKAKGQSAMGSDQDEIVVMPLQAVQRRLTGSQDVDRIMVSVREGASIDAVKEQLIGLLRERRNISEAEEDDFRVMDTRQIAETLTGTTRILTMLLAPWRR